MNAPATYAIVPADRRVLSDEEFKRAVAWFDEVIAELEGASRARPKRRK